VVLLGETFSPNSEIKVKAASTLCRMQDGEVMTTRGVRFRIHFHLIALYLVSNLVSPGIKTIPTPECGGDRSIY